MALNSMTGTIETVYAQALLELSQGKGQLDVAVDEMGQVGELLKMHPDLFRLLSSLVLSQQQREQSLERLFKGRVSDLTYRFLQVINQKGRMDLLPGIIRTLDKLVQERFGVVEVDLFVPQRLETAAEHDVAAKLGQAINRQVVVHQYVDPGLLGGMKMRVGDKLIDGSVATQLRILRQRLTDTGREKARQQAGAM